MANKLHFRIVYKCGHDAWKSLPISKAKEEMTHVRKAEARPCPDCA